MDEPQDSAAAGSSSVVMAMAPVPENCLAGSAQLNACAAGASSAVLLVALFPVDMAKTNMQARGLTLRQSMVELRASSFASLYRGLVPALAEQTANRMMLFGLGAYLLEQHVPRHWPEPARDASAGASAALLKTALLHPIDSIKCRWQLGMGTGSGYWGLYRGLAPAAVRSSAGMGIWLAARNVLERELPELAPPGAFCSGEAARHLLAGAISSLVTDTVTFPFDTLKKIQQSSSGECFGLLETATRLWRKGGAARFYRGYVARIGLVTGSGAAFNTVFVFLKQRLQPVLEARGF